MKYRVCELCNGEATVFCSSDSAFLCWSCDAKVHEANFLVARHVRQAICSNCKNLIGSGISGTGFPATCPSYPPPSVAEDFDSLSSSTNSSACISSTTSPVKDYSGPKRRCVSVSTKGFDSVNQTSQQQQRAAAKSRADFFKAEGIFVNWNTKLGLEGDLAVQMACRALRTCLDRWKILPFRVCLSASMWLGLRLAGHRSALTLQILKRLEEISGVPAKVILAAESKLARVLRAGRLQYRRQPELEEGWAEC